MKDQDLQEEENSDQIVRVGSIERSTLLLKDTRHLKESKPIKNLLKQ